MKRILLLCTVVALFASCEKKSVDSPILGMVALYEDAIDDVKGADNIIELKGISARLDLDLYNYYVEHKSELDALADDIKDYHNDNDKVYANPDDVDKYLAVRKDYEEIMDAKRSELKRTDAEELYMMERFEDFVKVMRRYASKEVDKKTSLKDSVYYRD
ncbi:MAG: hypothetical protein IJB01_05670 [Bacteroidaceae bacterium]|nr:hypothetical protein [Bacteroidaceae bacterium]